MKKTKKTVSLLLAVLLIAFSFVACNNVSSPSSQASEVSSQGESSSQPASSAAAEKIDISIAALNGPTGIGMAKLIDDASNGKTANNYHISLAGAPDEINAKIINGELDIAAVPTNLAAVLYNKTNGKVQMLALNTLGVLSIVTKGEEISSIADLKGKTIYATGQGSTPEYVLNYILKKNGLTPGTDVTVEYLSEHAELATKLLAGEVSIALLPEPFVTQVQMKDKEVKIALNLTEEWDKAVEGKSVLTMGCLIARKEFIEEHPDAIAQFLTEYEASAKYANDNTADCAKLVEKSGIIASAAMAEKAIPNCNIVYVDGNEMKTKAQELFQVLFEANPKSIGGKLPDEDFFYQK